jgi:hypothetical protein
MNRGRDLGIQPEPWQRWYSETTAELDARLDQIGKRLASSDPAEVEAAILAARLVPSRIADAISLIAPLRSHHDRNIAKLADDSMRSMLSGGPVAVGQPVPVVAMRPPIPALTAPPPVPAIMVPRPVAAYVVLAAVIAIAGAIALLIFVLRTKEVVKAMTERRTRRVAKGAAHVTRRLKKKLKKITFSS